MTLLASASKAVTAANKPIQPSVDPSLLSSRTPEATKNPPPPQQSKYLNFFNEWQQKLHASLEKSLPGIDAGPKEAFVAACRAVQSAVSTKKDAEKTRDEIEKQNPVNEAALADANQMVADAEQSVNDSLDACQKVAVGTVLDEGLQPVLSPDFDDADLVTYTVIMHATPQLLAQWCDEDEGQARQLLAAMKDVKLLRLFLESGGARNGRYGRAVEIYYQIQPSSPVLQRLALAVALELSDPYKLFNGKGQTDALQRYVHYEQAFLLGELDPNFSQFNVWELRQVVNSDATEDELSLGRESLLNYRPDIALSQVPLWRYCRIVKTDVSYNDPDWYKEPNSYDQILSGGGKCGPRAWYGRFTCKAFGIPTWGVRQPDHACMTRWAPDGWNIVLGIGLWKSWWEDQGGLDFLLETQARNACGSETVFLQKVLRLQWIASFWSEKGDVVRRGGMPDPNSPWYSLGMMQRRRLAAQATNELMFPPSGWSKCNRIAKMLEQQEVTPTLSEPVSQDDDTGAIVIPASACSDPAKQTDKVLFLPSFVGGQQLFVMKDAEIEYGVPPNCLTCCSAQYKLTCRVSTAHRKEEPILLTVGTASMEDPDTVHMIKLPYTMGLWEDTEALIVELGVSNSILRFARQNQPFGFSIKEIRLIPV